MCGLRTGFRMTESEKEGIYMEKKIILNIELLKEGVTNVAESVIAMKDQLTEIDSKLGDGDMGISMSAGAEAVIFAVGSYTGKEMDLLLKECAMALNRAAPSTMGTLLTMGLLALAKECRGKSKIEEEELIQFPELVAEAIMKGGHAARGDKTILDAMLPYAETLEEKYREGISLKEAHRLACKAAEEGKESTKGIRAKSGRASWLGERNMEWPDGGAVMFCELVKRISLKE